MICIHSTSLSGFIVIWLEIVKLRGGGGILLPSVYLGRQRAQSKYGKVKNVDLVANWILVFFGRNQPFHD